MIIGIDGNEANVKNRVGVNQYAFEVLWNIYKLSDEWKGRHKFVIYLRDEPLGLPKRTDFWEYRVVPGGGLWIIKQLTPKLMWGGEKLDIFWSPDHYAPPFLTIPRICSIMDLGYLKFSEQFNFKDYWQLRLWSAWSLIVSKRIIAISQTTADDIVRHYPFASKKVKVTLLAYNKDKYNTNVSQSDVRRVKDKYTMGSDYLLFLSTLKPSKNIEGLLKAWKMLEGDFGELKLVIAGKKGWLFESVFETVVRLNLEDRVIFTGFIPESEKPALLAGAKIFVMPSFWEGFGLDALSSLACGVPVVVSNSGSLPEVVGDAGIKVKAINATSIARGIRKVLEMDKISYNKLSKRGIRYAKEFSWEKTARETLEVFESLK